MSSPEARGGQALAGTGTVGLVVAGTGFELAEVAVVQQALGSEAEAPCVCERTIAEAWDPSSES